MTASVRVGGAWKTVGAVSTKVTGAWKSVAAGYVKVSGTWKLFLSSMTASASPDALSWSYNGSYYSTPTPTTATPAGGIGPYSYDWQVTSGSAAPDSPTSDTTNFTSFDGGSSSFVCLVTDSVGGAQAYTGQVTIS